VALIVEDGTGKSDAESYLSVADATTYAGKYGLTFSGTSTQQEEALRLATQYLDARFNTLWLGERSNEKQALDWPRRALLDADGFLISSTAMPQALKDATAELAIKARSETLMPDVSDPGTIASEDVQVGDLRVATSYHGGRSQFKLYRKVDGLLRDLVLSGARVTRA